MRDERLKIKKFWFFTHLFVSLQSENPKQNYYLHNEQKTYD
jgi:hypothetical protein